MNIGEASGTEIARGDQPEPYGNSGYLAWVDHNGKARIGFFSHCSCYDTWGALDGAWSGTLDELVAMAKRCADPAMPEREAGVSDCDRPMLVECYKGVLEWDASGRKLGADDD